MDAHVHFIFSIACQRLFLIAKKQGFSIAACQNECISRIDCFATDIAYVLAAFAGFRSTEGYCARLTAVIWKAVCWDIGL